MSYVEKVKRIPIQNMAQFQDVISGMAKAEKRPVHIYGTGKFNEYGEYNDLIEQKEFWNQKKLAIVNTRSNQLAQMVSPNYQILDHSQFFAAVSDKLDQVGVGDEFQGYILEFDDGDAYTARFIFPSVQIYEPGMGRNVTVGCEFSNSHNAMYAAKGAAFYLRISCTNQMRLVNVIPECVFHKSHVAPNPIKLLEVVDEKMDDFMIDLMKSGATFETVMNNAIESDIEYASPLQLKAAFENVLGGMKQKAEIISEMAHRNAIKRGTKYHLTRWNAYNAVTSVVTHNAMPPAVFDQILVKAEKKILNSDFQIPIAVPTQ